MPRTRRAIRRKNDIKKARRKQQLDISKSFTDDVGMPSFNNLHQYSKDIPLKRGVNRKTNNRLYGKKFNPSASYERKIDRMDSAANEYLIQ